MSDLNDPRVLFAAERTLLAWNRTAAGLIALGFFIDRASLMGVADKTDRAFAAGLGIAFVLLGVALDLVSILQYRRSIASLRPVEIPQGYMVNLAVAMSVVVAALGLLLAAYMVKTL